MITLANLAINITANSAPVQAGLRDVGNTAREQFDRSNKSVDEFRASLLRASDNLATAAKQMGGNMQAANDAIMASTAKSEAAVEKLATTVDKTDFKTFSERAGYAMGQGFGVGFAAAQTWLQKTEDYVIAKGKAIAIGMAIAAVSVTAAAVYSAYKIISGTLGFIDGLFTGESYKAASIDDLIALNNQVKELQGNLQITAQEASALLDVLARLNIAPADYTSVYQATTQAMRANGDELTRLGVTYKDTNGKLLSQQQVLTNAKRVLEEYTVGWDRQQAATAIGMGSYEKIVSILKVTENQLQASKDRLDEYGLGFGPERQAMVSAYEQAMRNFKNETKLTGDGFSGVVADQIMPAFTRMSAMFKDGWPQTVNLFRIGAASITTAVYGLVTMFDIAYQAIKGFTWVVSDLLQGTADAVVKALSGDFSGAAKDFQAGWTRAGYSVRDTWADLKNNASETIAALKIAWAFDDRGESLRQPPPRPPPKGKPWVPKPEAQASAYQTYINELDRTLKKLEENEYASMRLKAVQLAEKESITDLAGAYQRINAIQRQESQRVVDEMTRKLGDESAAYAFQTGLLGLTTLQQDKLTFAMQKRLELDHAIAAAKRSSKPLDDQAVAALQQQIDATIALGQAQRDQRDATSRSAPMGVQTALNNYQDSATNAAKNAESKVTGSLQRMEDAFVKFAKTGKLSFSDLFSFMAEEYLRQQIRMMIAGQLTGGVGILSSLGSMVFGAGGSGAASALAAGIIPLATGTNYVPYDGMPALLHKGEAVVPAAYNPANGGMGDGGTTINMGTTNVGAGVSLGQVAAMQRNSEARILEILRRGDRMGTRR